MTLMLKEIQSQPAVLERVLSHNLDKTRQLCREIKKRGIKFFYIAARGTSDHAAVYAKYVMETYCSMPVAFAAPSVITVYGGKPQLADALVIGISQSGKAEDVLEVINHAQSQDALTVSITNHPDSPLALGADFHFDCMAGEEKSVAATKTYTAQMMVMAMICAELSGSDILYKQLEEIPGIIAELLEASDGISGVAAGLKDMEECFVLSRGTNYSTALEGALKIQETCYVRAKAYAMSDFYHGPLALLDEKIPVFLIAPKGMNSGDSMEMMNTLNGYGIKVISITNDPDIAGASKHVIRIPDGPGDFTSPLATAVAMQLFACSLSLAKGLNPDNPRNIKKVTITR